MILTVINNSIKPIIVLFWVLISLQGRQQWMLHTEHYTITGFTWFFLCCVTIKVQSWQCIVFKNLSVNYVYHLLVAQIYTINMYDGYNSVHISNNCNTNSPHITFGNLWPLMNNCGCLNTELVPSQWDYMCYFKEHLPFLNRI